MLRGSKGSFLSFCFVLFFFLFQSCFLYSLLQIQNTIKLFHFFFEEKRKEKTENKEKERPKIACSLNADNKKGGNIKKMFFSKTSKKHIFLPQTKISVKQKYERSKYIFFFFFFFFSILPLLLLQQKKEKVKTLL